MKYFFHPFHLALPFEIRPDINKNPCHINYVGAAVNIPSTQCFIYALTDNCSNF